MKNYQEIVLKCPEFSYAYLTVGKSPDPPVNCHLTVQSCQKLAIKKKSQKLSFLANFWKKWQSKSNFPEGHIVTPVDLGLYSLTDEILTV